jgi:phosphatidylglycerol lysyltransferase
MGFEPTRLGEEPLVDLPERTWASGEFEWVRRQTNYCRRHGVEFEEVRGLGSSGADSETIRREVSEISEALLATKAQRREMKVFENRFDPANLWRRLFMARAARGAHRGVSGGKSGAEGRVLGIRSLPASSGCGAWGRPLSIHQAMVRLREEGAKTVSVSLIPGLDMTGREQGERVLTQWLIRMSIAALGPIFDLREIHHFKTRFRPRLGGDGRGHIPGRRRVRFGHSCGSGVCSM